MMIYALAIPAGFLGAGTTVTAQGIAESLDGLGGLDQIIGGSILLTVGVISLRMVLAAARHERETFADIETRYIKRTKELEEDLLTERQRRIETEAELIRERELRMSLEAAGISDRRHRIDDTDPGLPARPAIT